MYTVTKLGKVVIHKAKRNNNLSFSKGKTWQLEDMRVLQVVTVGLRFRSMPEALTIHSLQIFRLP